MNTPFVSLCPEITRANALTLMDWLEDEDVTRFLSDSRHVSRLIEQVIGRVQLPILTHLFNQGGRFFMAYDQHDVPSVAVVTPTLGLTAVAILLATVVMIAAALQLGRALKPVTPERG